MTKIMTGQTLRGWLSALASSQTLIAPTDTGGRTMFRQVSGVDEIQLDYDLSTLSAKEWFFPRTDTMFTIDPSGTDMQLRLAPDPRVLFGLRPCDARALAVLDRLFLAEPVDGLYKSRREQTALIGLGCSKQQLPECFCTSLGSGPHDASNVDVLLVGSGHGYAVEAITRRGQTLMDGVALHDGGTPPPPPEIDNDVPAEGLSEKLLGLFNAEYWERLADRCLGCRMCSFLCPTCHCFDVRDCAEEGRVERSRCWDSCQSAQFTKLACGHNPRGTKAARLRQFYAHKYLFFPERFGVTQCVGCGRCAHYCPVNIDIRETLRDLQRLEV